VNPFKLVRKLLKALRGGAAARQIFLAVFLGFAAGMIPGVNLTVLTAVVLLLMLNTNGGLAGLSAMLAKVLCVLLAPVTFHLGYFMMHSLGLVGLVRATADTPGLALLDLHVYAVLGALPIVVVVGGGLALAATLAIRKAQARIRTASETSEGLRKARENPVVRLLLRVALGKKRPADEDMAASAPLLRKGRLVAGGVILILVVAFQAMFLDRLARQGIEAAVALATGAEVNVGKADLSLLSGRLVVEGLQVTDAARPTHNQVQADRIVADVSLADLLARRFVLDSVESDNMRLDVQRAVPGKVYREPVSKEPVLPPLDVGGLGKVKAYYEQAKCLNEKIQKLKEFLQSDESTGKAPSKDDLEEKARLRGYLRLSAQGYLARHPTWVVRNLKLTGVKVHQDLPGVTIEGHNLSNRPSQYPEKMELKVYPEENVLEGLKKGLLDKGTGEKGLLDGVKGLFGKD
jgi:uncharacterized protein (TIGR03546 family)